jgi:membrane-associated phospholipid phosphatase
MSGELDRTRWWRWVATVVFPVHLMVTAVTIGLRWEHVLIDGAFVALAWAGPRAREFSLLAVPFALTALMYDYFRLVQHMRASVHVADLYNAELMLFGVDTPVGRQILPEFWRTRTSAPLDLICGFAYVFYLYELPLVAVYLYFRDKARMSLLMWSFFAVNLVGMATWLFYPAAPPWYVDLYGLGPAVLDAAPSAAGAARFDALLGVSYFESFYGRSSNVFGAMPSLHVSYSVLVVFSVLGLGWRLVTVTGGFALIVAFAAVYLDHHYLLDVIVGAVYAACAYALVALLLTKYRQRVDGALPRPETIDSE